MATCLVRVWKRGQVPKAGTALGVLRAFGTCPLFQTLFQSEFEERNPAVQTDPGRMQVTIRRCPFTLLMLTVLIVAGVYGQSHLGSLDAELHRQMGSSVRHLVEGQLHRLFTSIMFTAGGGRFYASLMMFAVSVGWVELAYGTRRACLTFFGVHLLTQLVLTVGIAFPLVVLQSRYGPLLFEARDVGPSAGYYGCLGLAIASLSVGKRNGIFIAIAGVLLCRLVWSTMRLPEEGRMMSADLAHLIAFPLGGLLNWRGSPRPRRCS